MKEYKRSYPQFSLCGLNCGLCPRYHTAGSSRCPGCGGKNFHLKHPSCTVITCSKKHENVEFCYECYSFPCEKYSKQSEKDSFITYRNVLSDFKKVELSGIKQYIDELKEKTSMLEILLENYNDGKRKSYYCLAVNLLDLEILRKIMKEISSAVFPENSSLKEKSILVTGIINKAAAQEKIQLKLRN